MASGHITVNKMICLLSERWREATPRPGQSGGGAGAQRERGEYVGLPVQAVPPPPWPEGPGARPGLPHRLGQAQHGSGPGQVSLSLFLYNELVSSTLYSLL